MAWNKQTFIDPPTVSKWLATVIFIIDIFLPGVGTMIIALLACSCEILIVGLLQLCTACLIVGWVWSILWGWELMQISRRPRGGLQADSNLGPDGLL